MPHSLCRAPQAGAWGVQVGKGAHAPSYLSQAPIQEILHFLSMDVSAGGDSHHCLIP